MVGVTVCLRYVVYTVTYKFVVDNNLMCICKRDQPLCYTVVLFWFVTLHPRKYGLDLVGVHLVGNIGRETVSFKSCCAGSYVGLLTLLADRSAISK